MRNLPTINSIKTAIKNLPGINVIVAKRNQLRAKYSIQRGFARPGHFYSPQPSLKEVRKDEAKIYGSIPSNIPGIDLHEEEQLQLLNDLKTYYDEISLPPKKIKGMRYYFENVAYSYSDAILLHGMIRYLKPKRIIEVGSGYSSALELDTNERFFGGSIELTYIEPHPALLLSLIYGRDKGKVNIIPSRLQDVDLSTFDSLQANDILFIDSTHVSKINSDVNVLFFDILPRLRSGVYIHFHDIFYPFEYPKEWIYEGRAWNELYILRAFLQYNRAFRIRLMSNYMVRYHESFFQQHMPLCLTQPGGNIWIRKE
jgi:hypothetical protein